MPPKPRGLAASRKAASVSAPAPPTPAVIRTAPVDADHLTIHDLYELRSSALELLQDATLEDGAEDARGLLRGILHACESLSTFLVTAKEEEIELVKALGLQEDCAKGQLAYLQAFALHELASILPGPVSVVASSSAAGEGGGKRRKVDVNEPVTAEAWLDLALIKYDLAVDELKKVNGAGRWLCLSQGEFARALCDRAVIDSLAEAHYKEPERAEKAADLLISCVGGLVGNKVLKEDEIECDVEGSILRSLASILSSFDEIRWENLFGPILVLCNCIESTASTPDLFDILPTESTTPDEILRRTFDVAMLMADAKAVEFKALESIVEDKYRPEDSCDYDGAEPGFDEVDFLPLPDEEDVRHAIVVGELGWFDFLVLHTLRM